MLTVLKWRIHMYIHVSGNHKYSTYMYIMHMLHMWDSVTVQYLYMHVHTYDCIQVHRVFHTFV